MEGSLYLIFVVVFGGFFLMNLILAAIMDSFEKVDKEIQIEGLKQEIDLLEVQALQEESIVDKLEGIRNDKI